MGLPESQEYTTHAVKFVALGSIRAFVDHREIDVGGPRQRRLLAALLVRAGETVRSDSLIEHVWDDPSRPVNARGAVRTYVARIRRALSNAGADALSIIVTEPTGYRVAIDDPTGNVTVDATRVAALVAAASACTDRRDGLAKLDEALSMWHGAAYEEFDDRPWCEPEVARLAELRLLARERRAEMLLELGEHGPIVADLELLVSEEPLRSRPVELLMLALFRANRLADAMRAASTYRFRVADVGLEISGAIAELESRIARSDSSLAVDRPHRQGLPRPMTSLVGRDSDVDRLTRLLNESRLVTLTGPGGIGKTRLALEVAETIGASRPDGVWFVGLADVDSGRVVAPRLAAGIGMTGSGPAPLDALVHWLADRDALLVIDNCEHVMAAVAQVVSVLLERTTVTVMCTSREALGVDGEVVRAVGPLDAVAARCVFVDRAEASGAEFDASAPEIDEICARLDGLVLAIELAAARVRSLGLVELAALLADDLRMLSGRSRIERHRTIRATIDWSHRMLDRDGAVVFRRLALFSSGCTLRAAESVVLGATASGGDEPGSIDVVDAISHLVDKSMLVPFEGQDGTRYRLLEPMRQFAYERLVDAGEEADVNRAYVRWARDVWSNLAAALETDNEEHHLTRAVDEWDNLVNASTLAHRIGDQRSAHSMIASTFPFAVRRGRFDVASWAMPLLSDASSDSDELFAEAASTLALAHVLRGEYETTTNLIDRADSASLANGMPRHWRSALSRAQVTGLHHHDIVGAVRCYEAALELEMSPTDAAIQHANLAAFVEIYLSGDGSAHRARARELLETHTHSLSGRATVLALLAFGATEPAEVRRLAATSIELADRVEATWPSGMARAELFRVAVAHDEPHVAFELLLAMLPDLHRTGGLVDAYTVLWRAARLLTRLGLNREAVVLDEVVRLAGSKTLFLGDDAMADFEPSRKGLSSAELGDIEAEAAALLASQHGSLRPVGEWLAALRPPGFSVAQ